MTAAVYRYMEDFGRMGTLEGIFVAEKRDVQAAMGKTVALGEVLGKHSEIDAEISEDTVTLITDDPGVVGVVEEYGLISGMNPLEFLDDTEDSADEDE